MSSYRSEHPKTRGSNAADTRVDQDGCASAKAWLQDRQGRSPALDERYVQGYREKLAKLCPNLGGLGRSRRRRRRR